MFIILINTERTQHMIRAANTWIAHSQYFCFMRQQMPHMFWPGTTSLFSTLYSLWDVVKWRIGNYADLVLLSLSYVIFLAWGQKSKESRPCVDLFLKKQFWHSIKSCHFLCQGLLKNISFCKCCLGLDNGPNYLVLAMLWTSGWQHCQWHCRKFFFAFLTELGNFR